MRHIGLFEGIGGFSLAAKWMGWETIAWCEINKFCQTVLKYHFSNAQGFSDIKATDFRLFRGRCDIVTAGIPCQPFSTAGKQQGTADDRHLWPEGYRAICEIQPSWIVLENVPGFVSWNGGLVLDTVYADLEAAGYEIAPPFIIPACAVNAPHRRDRVWIIAYSDSFRRQNEQKEGGQSLSDEDRNNPIQEQVRKLKQCGVGESDRVTSNASSINSDLSIQQRRQDKAYNPDLTGQDEGGVTPNTNRNGGGQGFKIRPSKQHDTNGKEWGITSDTHGINGGKQFQQPGSDGAGAREEPFGSDSRFTADTKIAAQQRDRICEELKEQPVRGCDTAKNGFDNFPTQSPICSGNDGTSSRLDVIALSAAADRKRNLTTKSAYSFWRNESLKSAGNAIVYKIAYQIFQAIEQYENSLNEMG